MEDGKTNETDTAGKETNTSTETTNEPISPLDETRKNLEELKAANDETEKELLRKEELKAKIALGGQTNAGKPEEPLTPEEKLKAESEARVQRIGEAAGAQWAKPKE